MSGIQATWSTDGGIRGEAAAEGGLGGWDGESEVWQRREVGVWESYLSPTQIASISDRCQEKDRRRHLVGLKILSHIECLHIQVK